jgi:flagellar biogenesis protein FliO
MVDIFLSYGIINSSQGMGRGYGPILFLLVMVLLIVFTVFIVFINKRVSVSKGNNIKVLERFYVANDKSLMVFSFNHVYYLVSNDKSGIRLIDKFSEEDMDVDFMTGKLENKFSNIMNKLSKQGLEDDKK